MATLRPCKNCGGAHRKKSAAKKCARAHGKAKPWSNKELGL
ncbi:MAG: hypothetical protein ACYTEO_19115 [Planctomycetota bacterium]